MKWAIPATFLVAGLCLGAGAALALRPSEASTTPTPMPSAVDIGFAQDMARHHAQAVQMSDIALTHDASPTVQSFARQILTAQAREMGVMQGWLRLWGAPQLPSGRAMTWMHASHAMDHETQSMSGLMPGMATQAQLNRLDQLSGASFDAEFVKLMTRHHEGGIEMASYASRHARLGVVRSLAASMMKDQTQEIAVMRQAVTQNAERVR